MLAALIAHYNASWPGETRGIGPVVEWSEPLRLDHRESDLSRLLDQLIFELVG